LARRFDGASNQFLQALGFGALAQPFTLCCVVQAATYVPTLPLITTPESLVFQNDSNALLMHNGAWLVSGTVMPQGVMVHVTAVAAGASSFLYTGPVAGSGQVASGNSGGAGVTNNLYLGGRTFAGSFYFVGRIAEAAAWAAALTENEQRALSRGISPRVVRPTALRGYWPLWGASSTEGDIDCSGRHKEMTTLGGAIPVAQHMLGSPMAL
jgi:hypothetical protein